MFAPLYECVKDAFRSRKLLPTFDGGYTKAGGVKLARTRELRDLFDHEQLSQLFESDSTLAWLSDQISQDRTPELRAYLLNQLDIDEITPQSILPKLRKSFLKLQSNEWIGCLYGFLKGQPALHRQIKDQPIIRLSNGNHVPAFEGDAPQVFLPGAAETGFPTVHKDVCRPSDAKEFLNLIGLTEPDPVDNVIRNVLPKYDEDEIDVSDSDYAADIACMLDAFQTDSTARRGELVTTLSKSSFLYAVEAASGEPWFIMPSEAYFKTDRLASLFDGIKDIYFVDPSYECLRGEKVRNMLEACGASRYLQREKVACSLSQSELIEIRQKAGLERSTWGNPSDFSLRGVDELLDHMVNLSANEREARAATLWKALVDVAGRTPGAFDGTYSWGYSQESKTAEFDGALVRRLNSIPWVPAGNGKFRVPSEVSFETLQWPSNHLLLSKICFMPAAINLLAKEVDIEIDVLHLLKKHGLTNRTTVLERLGLTEEDGNNGVNGIESTEDAAALGIAVLNKPSVEDANANQDDSNVRTPEVPRSEGKGNNPARRALNDDATEDHDSKSTGAQSGRGRDSMGGNTQELTSGGARASGSAAPFISYVAVDRDSGDLDDPDGLVQKDRMALEEAAIELILSHEQDWLRTPPNNRGFDLFKIADGLQCSWCEVKAMKGSLQDRPVGLSHAQFDCARQKGSKYWLYVVEQAGSKDARIVRIQDPAGKAKTFTFDRGWLDVAEVD